jgi:hypothetical protein
MVRSLEALIERKETAGSFSVDEKKMNDETGEVNVVEEALKLANLTKEDKLFKIGNSCLN